MTLRLLISISLLALVTQKVCAQSADEFFHTGAQAYLTNNTTMAKEQVDKGLKLFPNDIKLKKLDELLKQQQQQQNQQQQNQQQQKQSQQNQSQSKQDQQKQQQKQDEQKKQDQQKQQQQNQKPDQGKQGEKEQPKADQNPGQMTPEEAKRLLDGQKGDEKLLPANQKDKHERERSLKDW